MFDPGSGGQGKAPNGANAAVPSPHPHPHPHPDTMPFGADDWNLLFDAVVERLAQCVAAPELSPPAVAEVVRECVSALRQLRLVPAAWLRATPAHPNQAAPPSVPLPAPP